MGSKFGSIHARTEDATSIARALERELTQDIVELAPAHDGWVSLFPEDFLRTDGVALALAGAWPGRIAAFTLYDDDIFRYWLFEGGVLADEFDSSPDYFDGAAPSYRDRTAGNAGVLARFLSSSEEEAAALLANRRTSQDFDPGYLELFARGEAAMRAPRTPADFEAAIGIVGKALPRMPPAAELRDMGVEERRGAIQRFREASRAAFFGDNLAARAKLLAWPLLLEVATRMGIGSARARGDERWDGDALPPGWRRLPQRLVESRERQRRERRDAHASMRRDQRRSGKLLWERPPGEHVLGVDVQGSVWLSVHDHAVFVDARDGTERGRRALPSWHAPAIGADGIHLAGVKHDRSSLEMVRLDDGASVLSFPLASPERKQVVWAVAPDGGAIAIETTERLAIVEIPSGRTLHEAAGPRRPASLAGCWTEGGQFLLLAENRPERRGWSFTLLDRKEWSVAARLSIGDPSSWFSTHVQQLAVAPEAGLLFVAGSHGVLVLDLRGGTPPRVLTSVVSTSISAAATVDDTATGVALDPDESSLAVLGIDGFLRFWSVPSLMPVASYDARPEPDGDESRVLRVRRSMQRLAADRAVRTFVTWGRESATTAWSHPSTLTSG